jgi:hypothetical protein
MEGNECYALADVNPKPELPCLLNMSFGGKGKRAGHFGENKNHLNLWRIEPRVVQYFKLNKGWSELSEI